MTVKAQLPRLLTRFLGRGSTRESATAKKPVVTRAQVVKQYATVPSFADLLPWLEWSDEHEMLLLEDGVSVGAAYELKALPTEARPDAPLARLHQTLSKLLSRLLPLESEDPWVLQLYVQDDLSLAPLHARLTDTIAEQNSLDDPLAQKYLDVMQAHFKVMAEPDGILTDPMSGLPFRGKLRRIRLVLYRRYANPTSVDRQAVVEELATVCQRLESQLRQTGMALQRMSGAQFHQWMLRWFNPNPPDTQGDVDAFVARHPYPTRQPFGWSPSQHCLHGEIRSADSGWTFDGWPHKVATFKDLESSTVIGALSRELSQSGESSGDRNDTEKYALLDAFPPGTIYTVQITFESKPAVQAHLNEIESQAMGQGSMISTIHRNVNDARDALDQRQWLFRSIEAIYLRGRNEVELKAMEEELNARLNHVNLALSPTREEAFASDLYLRFLPFNLNYAFDKNELYRCTYKYADDLACLLPFYGRSIGDGINPLWIKYNRGGEPFLFDHTHPLFKMANSHMAVLGSTGSGKSVALNNLCLVLSAVKNTRIVVLEVGGSFSLSAKFLAQYN